MITPLTPETLTLLLSEPNRRRVFSAVALGASTSSEILGSSGLGAPEAAPAIGQLVRAGVLVSQGRGRLAVDDDSIAEAADTAAHQQKWQAAAEQPEPQLRGYIRRGLLVHLPDDGDHARTFVLAHVAGATFVPGDEYDERTVTQTLRSWCEGGPIDAVSLRRCLVDGGFLVRNSGQYHLATPVIADSAKEEDFGG